MSKSEIGLLCKDGTKLALGYISGKKGYYIDSLTKQGTEYTFTVGTEHHSDPVGTQEAFLKKAIKIGEQFVFVPDNRLMPDDWVLGSYQSKYYLSCGKNCDIGKVKRQIEFLAEYSKPRELHRASTHPKFDFHLCESDTISRTYAKVAINVIARLKGEEYVNQSRFEEIKRWILGESENDTFSQLPKVTTNNPLKLPKNSHWCIFLPTAGKLCAVVCFYNTFSRYFEAADLTTQDSNTVYGFICDWENKKECTLEDWIANKAKEICGEDS